MNIIIAGSRGITDIKQVEKAMKYALEQWGIQESDITSIFSGCATGVDRLGEKYASERSIPIEKYPALWDEYGKPAGIIRNILMAGEADALVAVWDGESRGTKHMISAMQCLNKEVVVHSER